MTAILRIVGQKLCETSRKQLKLRSAKGQRISCSHRLDDCHELLVARELAGERAMAAAITTAIFKPKVAGGFAQHGPRRRKKRWRLKPPLSIPQILAWAVAHHERTGRWPGSQGDLVYETPALTWRAVNLALRSGTRGLPGGTTLARLLAERLEIRNSASRPRLTAPQILAWADAHYRRAGKWPNENSGRVYDAPFETWSGINADLHLGCRGLAGGTTLARGGLMKNPAAT